MSEARFYLPVRVLSGKGIVRAHAADLAAFGKKALIVTGRRSAAACGVYDDICAALDEAGVDHVLFDEVEENPSTATVMRGRDRALEAGADFVIGAGGGSPMDAAKAVALMAAHPDKDAEYLYAKDPDNVHLPLVLIPTTCGTGSEVTAVSILSIERLGIKKSAPFRVFAELSLIDGSYLGKAPRSMLCNTAFDALSHLYESYVNTSATVISRMIAENGLRTWSGSLPVLLGERPAEDADRERLMYAAMLGGMAIAHTGTGIPHGLSYALTYQLGIPHGKAVNYFTAGYLKEASKEDRDRVLSLSGFTDIDMFSRSYEDCCGTLDVEESRLNRLLEETAQTLAADPVRCAKAPFAVDADVMRRIAFDRARGSLKE